MSKPSPICVGCHQEMRCERNERIVHDPEAAGFPATYWVGDEYKCPRCGNRIVIDFGKREFFAEELAGSIHKEEFERAVPFVHSLVQRGLLKQYGVIEKQ